jgi:hypothetical protein
MFQMGYPDHISTQEPKTHNLNNNKIEKQQNHQGWWNQQQQQQIKKHLCQNTQQQWAKTMLFNEYEQLEKL